MLEGYRVQAYAYFCDPDAWLSISDKYKYEWLLKTSFKLCEKLIFIKIYHTHN